MGKSPMDYSNMVLDDLLVYENLAFSTPKDDESDGWIEHLPARQVFTTCCGKARPSSVEGFWSATPTGVPLHKSANAKNDNNNNNIERSLD